MLTYLFTPVGRWVIPVTYAKGRAGWLGGLAGRFGQVFAVVVAVAVVSLFSPLPSARDGFLFTNRPILPPRKTLDKLIFSREKPSIN
jgi:hypothetical protein